MFLPNQKIVCIDANFSKLPAAYRKFYIGFPKQDRIYTVRDITQGIGGEVCCLLHQIHNPPNAKGIENGRPYQEELPQQAKPMGKRYED